MHARMIATGSNVVAVVIAVAVAVLVEVTAAAEPVASVAGE